MEKCGLTPSDSCITAGVSPRSIRRCRSCATSGGRARLLHLDTKKLERIAGNSHRIIGRAKWVLP